MASSGKTKELRLALVCYGGSSLAIYMHGVTKEIHRLVKGSSMLEPAAPTEQSASPSEQVYAELLRALATSEKNVRTRVVVDIVAGTSAGGINGICLAKAIARNLSLDPLRDLWFKRGDINGLLNVPPLPLKLDRLVPKKLRMPLNLARLGVRSPGQEPLRGKEMCQWIHAAFAEMESKRPAASPTLVPSGHRLQLYVTITDFFGYDRQVPNTDPNPIRDRRHRHALQFNYGNGADDFGDDTGLTLAARTTSCIPGVFPPVSLDKLGEWLGPEQVDVEALTSRYFRLYELADEPPKNTWFVDGGVLDNKPFGWAVDAIRDQPASHEVTRRLVYIEPDPNVARAAQDPEAATRERRKPPNTFAAAIGGLTGIPRSEPILDDLLVVTELNERAERIADIVETSEADVMQMVADVAGDLTDVPDTANDPALTMAQANIENAARDKAGLGYATYIRLKISQVVDRYALTACAVCDLPPDSNHALLVRAVVRQWARNKGLFEKASLPTPRQLNFLVAFDLDYGMRRLHFVIDGLRGWYDHADDPGNAYPSRAQIDSAKTRLYAAVETLRVAMDGRLFGGALLEGYNACFVANAMRDYMQTTGFDVSDYLSQYGSALESLEGSLRAYVNDQLENFTATLYADMLALAHEWPKARQAELLLRYLGFPFWDVLLFPVQALGQVGENDAIEVFRVSPLDATRIPALDPDPLKPKLGGADFHHFGAFFRADARQRDYLWGRLDGAERLLDIVLEHETEDVRTEWSNRLFAAILEEDAATVPLARDLVDRVRNTIDVPRSP